MADDMSNRPVIKPGDWISVGETDCVVANVLESGSLLGDCEVVYNPTQPTNDNVRWGETKWEFVYSSPSGGYADKYDRLKEAVWKLKQGRFPR